jgi:hypothetical protein
MEVAEVQEMDKPSNVAKAAMQKCNPTFLHERYLSHGSDGLRDVSPKQSEGTANPLSLLCNPSRKEKERSRRGKGDTQ